MQKKYYKLCDEELIQLFIKEKKIAEEAFNVFYRRYHIRVYSFFLRKLHNKTEAEDKHQETFEKFYKSVVSGQEIQNVESYIFTIAKNICINHEVSKYFCRKKECDNFTTGLKKEISIEEVCCLEDILIENIAHKMEVKELLDLIKMAIDKLEDKYKDPFIDSKMMEISIQGIAEKYNLSYDGAKKRVDRAMIKIKELLKPYIDDLSGIKN